MSMILSNQYFKAHMLGSDEYTSNDIDVEIQREIDASGHWLNHNEPQGDAQFEITEVKKKKHTIDATAKDFEELLERLEIRDLELSRFEQSVFPSCIGSYGTSNHYGVGEEEPLTVRPSAEDVGFQNSLLATQDLIRPLYCFEEEDICHFKDDRLLNELTLTHKKKKIMLEKLKRAPKPKEDTAQTEGKIPRFGYLEDLNRTLHGRLRVHLSEPFRSIHKQKPKTPEGEGDDLCKLDQKSDLADKVSTGICEIGASKQIQHHTGYQTISKMQNTGIDCRRSICIKSCFSGIHFMKQSKTEVTLTIFRTPLTVKLKFPLSVDPVFQQLMKIADKASPVSFYAFLEGRVPSTTMQRDSSSVQSFLSQIPSVGGFYIIMCVGLQIYRLGVTLLDGACCATSFLCKSEYPQFLCMNYRHSPPWWRNEHGHLPPTEERCLPFATDMDSKHSNEKGKCHLIEYCEENNEFQVLMPEPLRADLDDTLDLHENATNLQRKECYNLHNIVIVQAAIRGYLGRQHYKAKVEDKLKKVCCLITKVQACWRSWKLRRLYLLNYRKIITVQSHIRGFLARRRYKASMMDAKERKLYYLISRVQARWRGRKIRESDVLHTLYLERIAQEKSAIKVQAMWRGIRTRKRFLDAVKNSKYDDFDEFDYSPVNDADYLPMKLKFEEIDVNREVYCSEGQLTSSQQHHLLDHGDVLKLALFPKAVHTASEDSSKRTFTGVDKHQATIDERNSAVAEIAKDWGFKEEKTALQFLRALENTHRRGEPQKAIKADSMTQLKARNERDKRILLRTSQHANTSISKQTLKSSATQLGIF